MKIQRYSGNDERSVLIGMITDSNVLAKVTSLWDGGLFQSRWSNIVGDWCVEYYTKYGRPPRKAIESLFHTWAEENDDRETTKLVEKFLEALSGQYQRNGVSSDYIVDLAGKYFNRVRLLKHKEAIESDVEAGDLEKAERRIGEFTRIEIGKGSGIKLLVDTEQILQAHRAKNKPLVVYPGALKNFFGHELGREAFIAFMGPQKRSKSFWLLDVAWRALIQGRKVAFFEAGDLSQNQVLIRFSSRAAHHPSYSNTGWPLTIKWPMSIDGNSSGRVSVESQSRTFNHPLTGKSAIKAFRQVVERYEVRGDALRLAVYPNTSLSVRGIRSVLKGWERESGWIPDVIVIDYADILAKPPGFSEHRDGVNANWMALRAISQEMHCLVVTATQTNAAGFKTGSLDRSNFSEDNRKLSHVTGMVGLNEERDDKKKGVLRINWVVLREGFFYEKDHVIVAQCLAVANPCVRSVFLESMGDDRD